MDDKMKKIVEFLKKRYMLVLCLVSVVLLVFVFPRLERRGTFGLAENEYVTLTCPSAKGIGETFDCNIVLHNTNKTILAINANYDLAEEITYQGIAIANNSSFELLSVNEEDEPSVLGFAVYSENGVNDEVIIGTITFKISDTANANTNYKVGLKNVELVDNILVDESYEMLEGANTETQVRTFNNVATLSDLVMSTTTLNEEFASNTFNYTATVSPSTTTVTITPTKSDNNSVLSGTGAMPTVNLHYGTNPFTITVTSEDGNVTNTYTISIYREYAFTTKVYTYNSTDNYIYVGGDSDEMVVSNLEMLSDGLNYNISDDNLRVLYNNEVLVSIKLVNFNSEYLIIGKKIYLSEDVTYADILENIVSDDVTFKLFDNNNQEITDNTTTININNHKLNVYYDDELIDVLTFSDSYLQFSNLVYDNNLMLIKRLVSETTYGNLKSKIATSGTISITSNKGGAITDEDIVKTGDTITITLGDDIYTYTLSVLGDTNGDGLIKLIDVGRLYKYYNETLELSVAQIAAGDINGDGAITMIDVGRLYKFQCGNIPVLEVGGH